MQDKYAFDAGDYGKFSLLRHLVDSGPAVTLGVLCI